MSSRLFIVRKSVEDTRAQANTHTQTHAHANAQAHTEWDTETLAIFPDLSALGPSFCWNFAGYVLLFPPGKRFLACGKFVCVRDSGILHYSFTYSYIHSFSCRSGCDFWPISSEFVVSFVVFLEKKRPRLFSMNCRSHILGNSWLAFTIACLNSFVDNIFKPRRALFDMPASCQLSTCLQSALFTVGLQFTLLFLILGSLYCVICWQRVFR